MADAATLAGISDQEVVTAIGAAAMAESLGVIITTLVLKITAQRNNGASVALMRYNERVHLIIGGGHVNNHHTFTGKT